MSVFDLFAKLTGDNRAAPRTQRTLGAIASRFSLMVAFLTLAGQVPSQAADEISEVAKGEASLRAVTFIDPDRGWVAGQHGVILNSEDGGLTWKSQATPSRATLHDIAMYNSQRGLAVGGSCQPHTQRSVGEVLVTKDGGATWQSTTGHDLPRLRKLLIGPGGKGVAIGDWSPVQLTSVFATSDGGFTWEPRLCNIAGSLVGLCGSTDDFLVLSDQGQVVRFKIDTKPQTIFLPDGQWQTLAGDKNQCLLQSSSGMIISADNGETWQAVRAEVPIANSLRSGSRDAAWSLSEPSTRAAFHLDGDRGWAVGDYGLVSLTRNGGETWRTVRGGDRYPAAMFVASEGQSLPWSLIALESLQHQRRIAIVIDGEKQVRTFLERERLDDSTAWLGPTSIHVFNDTSQPIATFLQSSGTGVVVLDQALSKAKRAAWTAAAVEVGVKRVLEVNSRGTQTVHVASAIPEAGILASDVWADAISRLAPGQLPPAKLMLSPLVDVMNDGFAADGIAGFTRNDARYGWSRPTTSSRRQLQVLQARTSELSWIESLVKNARGSEDYQQQLAPVLQRMNSDDRQHLFVRLAALTSGQHRHDLYVTTLELIVTTKPALDNEVQYREQELIRLAQLRLDAVRQSAEWRHTFGRALKQTLPNTISSAIDPALAPISLAVQLSPFQSPSAAVANSAAGSSAVVQTGGAARQDPYATSAVQLASGTSAAQPTSQKPKQASVDLRWEFHPVVLMVAGAGERNRNTVEASANQLLSPASLHLRRLSGTAAAGRWSTLASNSRDPETIRCPVATTRPYLDGSFEEPWWQGGQPFQIGSSAGMVRMAHDSDFVYFAIQAPLLDSPPQADETRQRDTNLDHTDRYRIRIDVDRDLLTAYEFEFDANGNTRDSCDGFLPFQPRWFIANKAVGDTMTTELAIQKADLGEIASAVGTIWNVSLDRLHHETAVRGLSMPAAESWRPVILE